MPTYATRTCGGTDLLGADLRAADLRGAKLDQSIFLTQVQLDAARGGCIDDDPICSSPPWALARYCQQWSVGNWPDVLVCEANSQADAR